MCVILRVNWYTKQLDDKDFECPKTTRTLELAISAHCRLAALTQLGDAEPPQVN
jgi:hypothetical protein